MHNILCSYAMASPSCLQRDDSNIQFVPCTDGAQWKPNCPVKNRIPEIATHENEVEPYCECSRTCICVTSVKMVLLLLCGFLFLILRFNFRTGSSCKGETHTEKTSCRVVKMYKLHPGVCWMDWAGSAVLWTLWLSWPHGMACALLWEHHKSQSRVTQLWLSSFLT